MIRAIREALDEYENSLDALEDSAERVVIRARRIEQHRDISSVAEEVAGAICGPMPQDEHRDH